MTRSVVRALSSPNSSGGRVHHFVARRSSNERGRLSMPRPAFAAVALAAAVSCPGPVAAQGAAGTLTGVITDASGAAVAGAFVQMRNAERRLNFMVITQEQGKYSIDRLPAGKYIVQAIGGEHQSAPSSAVEVAAGKAS